ncbi:MAG: YebC/PmpR family DNA-binding transcriptional regulator [bacterium]|nr:YebC/PmpR family DNA-binding transcriptional regulator [bacterium]
MSGHSKWSTIKHKKAAADAKRGKVFTRLIKEITIAAKLGGGDIDGNPRLRSAVAAAKGSNMPADNIKRAIQKGTGELPGVTYEEVSYEGYGPGGVAILIETLTDNRMRTTPEIRHVFSKYGGNLGEPNSVAWMFDKKGQFVIPASAIEEDRLMEIVLEAGADDLTQEDEHFVVQTTVESFHAVQQALEAASITPESQGLIREPQNTVELDGKKAEQCLKLLDMFEDHDDVQNVHANLEFDPQALESEA